MNKRQTIALAIAVADLVLVLLFPPFDYLSLQHGNVATFDGFYFAFGAHPNRAINSDFLTLEVIVLLINACIAGLLLRERPLARKIGGNRYQRGVLWVTAINLIVALLFPPFENYKAISHATVPTFEGFYFVLADNSQRQLVSTILDIEIALMLANGGLLWLLLKDRGREQMTAEQVRKMAQKVRETQSR
jgi:heme/copper-type cytochrome/quinol oxidase subunit 2